MPSTKDPNVVVQPGPGILPAGVVPASALLFVPGGGADAALTAHINNPRDAHFAHAIGVDPYYPPLVGPTPDPILTSVGGVVAGENVLDFINQFKALIPPTPNPLGFSSAAGGSGIPNWDILNALGVGTGTTVTGGYDSSGNVAWSHFLAPHTVTTFSPSGLLFPADKGVIALYKTTQGNFFDPTHTTLVAALSLNDTAPAGIPNAAFNEGIRNGGPGGPAPYQQVNYTGSGTGLDLFSLTFRLPYLTSYAGYPGTPFGPFPNNFYFYQLAVFALTAQTIGAGDSQSWLLVQWKETYATSLALIQPTALTFATLNATNCYSAVPTSSTNYTTGSFDDDTTSAFNINRHFVFKDNGSGSGATGTAFTSAPVGTVTTRHLSGVKYYDSTGLQFNVDIQATGLFSNSFETGSTDNPPNVPDQFHSVADPIQMDFTNFGGGIFPVPYYVMNKLGSFPTLYSATNAPATGDTGEYQNATLAIYTPSPFMPVGGYAQLTADLHTPWLETVYTDPNKYLLDTYTPGSQSTTTYEPFVDEFYRYITSFDPTTSSTVPIVPTGGNAFPSSTAFVSGGSDLQVVGQEVIYPQTDYNVATFFPAQTIDYSGLPGGDGVDNLRRHLRAVDTGVSSNTGWIRLRGLAQAAFTTNAAYNGTETTGHLTGGAIVQLKVPGASGSDWLDLGRASGDPGVVGSLGTSPFYGCSTGVIISGSDVYVSYQTGSIFTSNNGSGNYLLFVRVTFINGPGTGLILDQYEWYPSTFTPP